MRRRCSAMIGRGRISSSVAAIGFSALALALSACSGPTALDSFLAQYNAEPGPCVGTLFDRVIDDADFECWRVAGIDDLEAFTQDVATAVNGGTSPTPDRSFCLAPFLFTAEADCAIEWGSGDSWLAVDVVRDLYSAEWDSLEITGEFPAENISTIVVARSTVSLTPEGNS